MTLRGHDDAVAALLDAARSGRLHHAWLLAGPQGVGKALFADLAARRLLAEAADPSLTGEGFAVPEDHPTLALLRAGSHPDFARIERTPNDKGELARSIKVDQVRKLQRLFATTPTFSARRVVVIDAIEDMEREGANALLKNLEEPPADTVFLLVSHAPGRLLPTIRSRCRALRFGPLEDADMAAVLRAALPEADGREVAALAAIGGGAPGQALRFAGLDIAGLDAAIERIVRDGDPTNALRAALARTLALKAAQSRYEAFLERAPARIAQAARAGGERMMGIIALWRRARAIADEAVRLSLEPQTTVFEIAGMLAQLAPAPADRAA